MTYRGTTFLKPLRIAGLPAAAGAIAVWSTNALAANFALQRASVWPVLVAMTAGAVLALVTARAVRPSTHGPPDPTARLGGLLLGLVGLGGTLVLQYLAFAAGPLVETNVISYGWPMFAALALVLHRHSRGEAQRLGCALAGFAGVAVMVSGSAGDAGAGAFGYIAALGSALCMAAYTLAVTRARMETTNILLAGAVGGLVVSVLGWWASGTPSASLVAVVAAGYCGAGPVATGFLLWSRAMTASGSRLAPLGYAIPVLSTTLLVVSGSPLGLRTALGATLVVGCAAGVLAAERVR